MVKKYFFIFFLLLSLIYCQQNHKSQNAAPNGIISKNIVTNRGYILNITAGRLTNLAEIDPNLILVDISGIPGDDSVIKVQFKQKYLQISASAVYLKPDTLPRGKSIVLVSLTGRKSQKAKSWHIFLSARE